MAFKLRLDSLVVLRTSLPDCASLKMGRHKLTPRPGRWTFGIAEGALTLPIPPHSPTSFSPSLHTPFLRPSLPAPHEVPAAAELPLTFPHAIAGPRTRFPGQAYHVHLGPLQRADIFWALKTPGKLHLTQAEL